MSQPIPEKVGHLVFVSELKNGQSLWKCTFEECGKEVRRQTAYMISARQTKSACNSCRSLIRRGRSRAVKPGSPWKGVEPK